MKQGGEGCELCFRVKGVKSSMLISTNSNITKFGAVKVILSDMLFSDVVVYDI